MTAKTKFVLTPELDAEWHPTKNKYHHTDPRVLFTDRTSWWLDSYGHDWQASIRSRMELKSGCPQCSGRVAIPGETDLLTLFPHVHNIWDYKFNKQGPENYLPKSNYNAAWDCGNGHRWYRRISHQARTDYRCLPCAGENISYCVVGYNDLKTLLPEIFAMLHPTLNKDINLEKITVSSGKKLWWVDAFGHAWFASVAHVVRGTRCPYCANRKVLLGFNDVATIRPDLVLEWDKSRNGKWTPYNLTAYSNKRIAWKCYKGHTWKTSIRNRVVNLSNCPDCVSYQSSRIETNMFNLIQEQYYPDALHGAFLPLVWKKRTRANVDVFIPSLNLVIEYDGEFHHKGEEKRDNDIAKSEALITAGYNVIRVRERSLGFLEVNEKVRQISYTPTGRGARGVNLPDLMTNLFGH